MGLGTKGKAPHEDADAEAVERQEPLHGGVQGRGAGEVAAEWPQRSARGSGTRDPRATVVSVGQAAATGRRARRPVAAETRPGGRNASGDRPVDGGEREAAGAA